MNNMTKKELEIKLSNLASEVDCLKEKLNSYNSGDYLTIDHARIRDSLVRKNFYGRITDPRIKADFKNEIEKKLNGDFGSITIHITNFEFYDNEKCILEEFNKTLREFEYKQIILDAYPIKKEK